MKVDADRLTAAYQRARTDLLAERNTKGHWVGELSSSPLATATAISALVLAEQHSHEVDEQYTIEQAYQCDLSELIVGALHWLARHQNADGGWGDTEKSLSNVATTMLVCAAFHLTGVPVKYSDMLVRAEEYLRGQGSGALRRRFGRDHTFTVPILTNYALADLAPWRDVPTLPFELARLPRSASRWLRMPWLGYVTPALVALGQVKFHNSPPVNPIARMVRSASVEPSLKLLERMQPESGGFFESTPLTSFVVMSLAGIGKPDHPVLRRGVEFLLASVRSDGSWPIDTNLATWNTTLAINALAAGGESPLEECLDWLLRCQHTQANPATGMEPGGWSWTDLSGGVPDVDDTAGALMALALHYSQGHVGSTGKDSSGPQVIDQPLKADLRERVGAAAVLGTEWLINQQNRDGGWPTFCRGRGKMPFDRSAPDLTAHAMRAIRAWREMWRSSPVQMAAREAGLIARCDAAIRAGLRYLAETQREDGGWLPMWFGNQHAESEVNPVIGTARVIMALCDLDQLHTPVCRRALGFLVSVQNANGGWGAGPAAVESDMPDQYSSVEESALALDALLCAADDEELQVSVQQGLDWLVLAVEQGRHRETSPVGFSFAKLWYYERLYPLTFAASALGHAVAQQRHHPTASLRSTQPAYVKLPASDRDTRKGPRL
ncbi:MAG: prenyltransferase/squalene oxidase repeat-containing protein [Pirellulales bacterium]